MNQQPQTHEPPRIAIPDGVIRIATLAAYAIGGLLAGQVIGILLFY